MSTINQSPRDHNDERHGEWIHYYDNGQLQCRINYFHGTNHGLWESYDYNGKLLYRGYFNMDREIGFWYYEFRPNEYYLWLI